MQQPPTPPNEFPAVADMVYPVQLASEYFQDGAAIEASKDLGAGEAAGPPLDSGYGASAVAASQPTSPSHASSSSPSPMQPGESSQPSVPTASSAHPQTQSPPRGQTHGPQSRRVGIDGHAAKNQDFEVGNFNVFFGNWGTRAQAQNMRGQKGLLHHNINRQIVKCPCIVLTLAEANEEVASDLEFGYYNCRGLEPNGLDDRPTYEHFVLRSRGPAEDDDGVLIACRKDNTTGLNLLLVDVHMDHTFRENGQTKSATTRTIIGEVLFKQNVGHLGQKINICVSHLNNRTAKNEWPVVKDEYFDGLACRLVKYEIKFLTGDFNMALLQVVEELRSRGIRIDCVAWHPWYLRTLAPRTGGPLGIDSCAIFYIGGNATVTLRWGLSDIDRLEAAVADGQLLDVYNGTAWPGQHWTSYAPKGRRLREHLESFLKPTTTKEILDRIPRGEYSYCPYLRIKQKTMRMDYCLYQGNRHNGAHYPLVMQTHNASARSEKRVVERREERRGRTSGHGRQPQSRNDPQNEPARSRGSQPSDEPAASGLNLDSHEVIPDLSAPPMTSDS